MSQGSPAQGAAQAGGAVCPRVSVIIIFLNGGEFLREAIETVLAQSYDNWELLLVDDGSTDRSSASWGHN